MNLIVVLGNQLFDPSLLIKKGVDPQRTSIFIREDRELCTHFRYHKHKIIFFLAAMRAYADELRAMGFKVFYQQLDQNKLSYEDALIAFLELNDFKKVGLYEIEDKFFEKRILGKLREHIPEENLKVWNSPMFLTPRSEFKAYLQKNKKPFMKTFYETQRKRLKILVDKELKPTGGKWSFDEENRKPLPKTMTPPKLPFSVQSDLVKEVIRLVDREFKDHPGEAKGFWLPIDRRGAEFWLMDFLEKRFENFGPYEDAIPKSSDFVFHSVLTPFLNVGLLTPQFVISEALRVGQALNIPMNSLEGFIRQVIGWREFIRGVYQNFSEAQETKNFWNHKGKLTSHWYDGTTGIEPLDDVIKKTLRFGYAHHIERLMVVGSLMQLLEVHPDEGYKWFMEMFVDSSDWVMGPNVYGMALFSDGGLFATKPYICGSNYYKKMGPYKEGDWQDGVDGLYWSFIDRQQDFFKKQFRSNMMIQSLNKMPADRKQRIFKAAEDLKQKLTW